jgi:GDSL-like Lipase/Acylhydrolase family
MRWLLPLLMIILAGSSSSPSGSVSKPTVVFAGDSITVDATAAIHQRLDSTYNVEIRAKDGLRISQDLPKLASAVRSHPYAVVENLGTNDALHGGTDPDWMSSWDHMIRITRSTPCVVLTTINPTSDSLVGKPIATRINAEIMTLAAQDPKKYQVADWSGFLGRHAGSEKAYLQPQFILIHPTALGASQLAALDQHALAMCGHGSP